MSPIPRCSSPAFLQLSQWILNPLAYLDRCDLELHDELLTLLFAGHETTNCQLTLTGKLPVIPARRGITFGPKSGVTVQVEGKQSSLVV